MTATASYDPAWSRRDILRLMLAAGGAGLVSHRALGAPPEEILQRAIPRTGEKLPAVGLGTWQTFDVGASEGNREPLRETLKLLAEMGGSMVDSSPMYGRSEAVVGDLLAELGQREAMFLATKVWTRGGRAGIEQMERSLERFRTERLDLMQIHNLLDWQAHLPTLREWKEGGRIRYLGITHYLTSRFDDLESVIRAHQIDFVQLNYSLATREAEERLLPVAADRGVAVIINRPYESGSLFRAVRGRALPEWTAEFDCASWGQFFLKYILSHPAVTCVIPGTSKPRHLRDNLSAGYGRLPDAGLRRRMVEVVEAL